MCGNFNAALAVLGQNLRDSVPFSQYDPLMLLQFIPNYLSFLIKISITQVYSSVSLFASLTPQVIKRLSLAQTFLHLNN